MEVIQSNLLAFINDSEKIEENYQNLTNSFDDQKIQEDSNLLKSLLNLIAKIASNHCHVAKFFDKIEQILSHLKEPIKKSYSNSEIFNIFKNNKRILLFLIEQEIIKMDENIARKIMNYESAKYPQYFYPEIKSFINTEQNEKISKEIPENFDECRKNGENENYVCELIRKDLIEDFIIHINKTNCSLESKIDDSIFETNRFLIKSNPTFIEYAAFFGSIQIFKYLHLNKVELNSSLFLNAIHGNNPELIHYLEENLNQSNENDDEDYFYEDCFKEAIKCHHNDIAQYFLDNYFKKNKVDFSDHFIKCYNFAFMNQKIVKQSNFYYFCKYDYILIVDFLLKKKKINVNKMVEEYVNTKRTKKDSQEMTALSLAIEEENIEILKLLLSREELDINKKLTSYQYDTINRINYAKDWNNQDYNGVHEFVEQNTPFNVAVRKGNLQIVKLLLLHDKLDINLMSTFRDSYYDIWEKFIWGGSKGIQGLSVDNSDGRLISIVLF